MWAYCAGCGEQRRGEGDYSLRRFLARAAETVTNMDSTVGRSFASLFVWPGHLTAEHYLGRRRPYLDPVQLFLICNLVFFAIASLGSGGPFTTSFGDQLRHHPYSPLLQGLPTGEGTTFGELLNDPVAFESYAQTYDAMTQVLAKSLIVLMVPVWSLLSWLLYGRSARFYAQHLVFALHVWAYLLLLFCLVGIAISGVRALATQGGLLLSWQVWDLVTSVLLAVMVTVYLAEAGRRAFSQPLRWTVPKALVLTVAILPIAWVYRLILFFATVAAI
jgi:hypothetical protein